MYWIEFTISAVVIIFAGIRLTKYADKLSEQTSIGKAWIGLLLLGLVTSLPEAVTSIFSVVSLKANNLALGNILGSNNFNPMLFVVMDIVYRKNNIRSLIQPKKSHRYACFWAVGITLLVIIELLFSDHFSFLQIGTFGLGSIAIALLYLTGMRMLSKVDAFNESDFVDVDQKKDEFFTIWVNIAISAAVVVFAAIWLAKSADVIADQTGLGRTFVGSVFLAIVTSLPEMVVSISALRLGAIDLAIGNIFGSNMTNLFIIFICDAVYVQGSFFQGVSKTHIITAVLSMGLTAMALANMHSKSRKRILGVGRFSIVMIITFVIGTYFLYTLR